MRTRALLCLLLGVSFASAQHPGAASRESKRLEGTWVVVSEPKAAPILGDDFQKGARWIIKAGLITFDRDLKQKKEERVWRYYRVDPTRNPRGIEIAVFADAQGGEALVIQHGVYTLEGDQLRLYLADLVAERPVRFPRQENLSQPVLTLQRARR